MPTCFFLGNPPPAPLDGATYSAVRPGIYGITGAVNNGNISYIVKLTTDATNTTSYFWQVCKFLLDEF